MAASIAFLLFSQIMRPVKNGSNRKNLRSSVLEYRLSQKKVDDYVGRPDFLGQSGSKLPRMAYFGQILVKRSNITWMVHNVSKTYSPNIGLHVIAGGRFWCPWARVLTDFWSPSSGVYPDDQFGGVFPASSITVRRK